jgi:hypothetical protein
MTNIHSAAPPKTKAKRIYPQDTLTALIDTIKNEARRNRHQQHTEHHENIRRENITIGVLIVTFGALALTCWAIIQQVDEMRKAYKPIAGQATAINSQLEVMKEEGRAWVGPLGFAFPMPYPPMNHLRLFLVTGISAVNQVRISLFLIRLDFQKLTHTTSVRFLSLVSGLMARVSILALFATIVKFVSEDIPLYFPPTSPTQPKLARETTIPFSP